MAVRNTPSRGGKPDKLMRAAIMVALNREATAADGKKTKKLSIIADRLVDLATSGDLSAIKEICDRVDGRPLQGLSGEVGNPVQVIISGDAANL